MNVLYHSLSKLNPQTVKCLCLLVMQAICHGKCLISYNNIARLKYVEQINIVQVASDKSFWVSVESILLFKSSLRSACVLKMCLAE